jgi:hypothetical protein
MEHERSKLYFGLAQSLSDPDIEDSRELAVDGRKVVEVHCLQSRPAAWSHRNMHQAEYVRVRSLMLRDRRDRLTAVKKCDATSAACRSIREVSECP